MRHYELVVILNPSVADEDVTNVVDRLVRRPIEGHGGRIEETDHWGRRRLAYPIDRQAEGNYVVTQIQMDPQQTKELERGLKISEDVLRHLLVRAGE